MSHFPKLSLPELDNQEAVNLSQFLLCFAKFMPLDEPKKYWYCIGQYSSRIPIPIQPWKKYCNTNTNTQFVLAIPVLAILVLTILTPWSGPIDGGPILLFSVFVLKGLPPGCKSLQPNILQLTFNAKTGKVFCIEC